MLEGCSVMLVIEQFLVKHSLTEEAIGAVSVVEEYPDYVYNYTPQHIEQMMLANKWDRGPPHSSSPEAIL